MKFVGFLGLKENTTDPRNPRNSTNGKPLELLLNKS